MKKKHVILSFLLILSILMFIIPTKAQTYDLDPLTYIDRTHQMDHYDLYTWSFSSTASEIMVVALDQAEYDAFSTPYQSFTAILNRYRLWNDGGDWRPPHSDTWHILYFNVGDSITSITINDEVSYNHFKEKEEFPWIPVLIGVNIGAVAGIAGIVGFYLYKKKRRMEQIPMKKLKYCPESVFCMNCGVELKNPNQQYCIHCGRKLSASSVSVTRQEPFKRRRSTKCLVRAIISINIAPAAIMIGSVSFQISIMVLYQFSRLPILPIIGIILTMLLNLVGLTLGISSRINRGKARKSGLQDSALKAGSPLGLVGVIVNAILIIIGEILIIIIIIWSNQPTFIH